MGGASSYLELVVVRLAAAVRLLGHFLVGVKQEADATVITHLHVFHTCKHTSGNWFEPVGHQRPHGSTQRVTLTDGVGGVVGGQRQRRHTGFVFGLRGRSLWASVLIGR